MSELRKNPLTGQWVIIAGGRGQRPHEYERPASSAEAPAHVETCPFCPGNERETPPAILEVAGPTPPGGWQIRVFANKYPALGPGPAAPEDPGSRLLAAMPGEGAHEVIVETPLHNGVPSRRSQEDMKLLARIYQRRYVSLMERPSVQLALVFKNHGEQAGTSLEHPHSQVMASPVVPDASRRKGEIAREHYQRTGRCLLCDIAEEEFRLARTVVYQDERFLVFHPYAAAFAGETWIVSLDHRPSFGEVPDAELDAFAAVLLRSLRQLAAAFGDPDFNYIIHSAPRLEQRNARHYWHWYLQIVPRTARAAGFEIGTGIYINTLPPETAADMMRQTAV